MVGGTISVSLTEIVELALSRSVGVGVIVCVTEGSRKCFVGSKVDSSCSLVQVWFETVCSVACQERGCLGDFGSIVGVSGWVRGEDQGKTSGELGEFGTSSIEVVRFIQLGHTRGRGSARR